MPHRESKTTKKRQIDGSEKKKKQKKTKPNVMADEGARRNPARHARRSGSICEMTNDEFMSLVSPGLLAEEDKRRFKETLAVDDSGASGNEGSATEVIPSPPGL